MLASGHAPGLSEGNLDRRQASQADNLAYLLKMEADDISASLVRRIGAGSVGLQLKVTCSARVSRPRRKRRPKVSRDVLG
jgi:hypothetical protein